MSNTVKNYLNTVNLSLSLWAVVGAKVRSESINDIVLDKLSFIH